MQWLLRWLRRYLGLNLLRVLVMPLDAPPAVTVKHPHLRYALLQEPELLEWARDPELELDAERVHDALCRGDLCVGVSGPEGPIGYIWFAFEAAPHVDGSWVHFAPFCRYSYKSFIRPSRRGKRISQELYTRASGICPRRGAVFGILCVDLDNRPSLQASRRAGRVPVGYAFFMRIFGRVVALRSPGAARYGFAIRATGTETGARPLAAPPVLPLLKRR